MILAYPFTAGEGIPFIVTFFIIISLSLIFLNLDMKLSIMEVLFFVTLLFMCLYLFLIFRESSILIYTVAIVFMLLRHKVKADIDYRLKYVFLCSIILSSFTWQPTKNIGRYAIHNGDPNYTAVIMFVLFFTMISYVRSKHLKALVVPTTAIFLIYLTQSRMLLLMLILFTFLKYVRNDKVVNLAGVSVFVSAISIQFIIFKLFFENLGVGGDGVLVDNINDGSNLSRIQAYKNALDYFTFDTSSVLWGNADYTVDLVNGYFLQVHNGLLGMLVRFGAIFTLIYFSVLLWFCIKSDSSIKPLLYCLVIASGILGPWIFGTSIVIVSLFYSSPKYIRCANESPVNINRNYLL